MISLALKACHRDADSVESGSELSFIKASVGISAQRDHKARLLINDLHVRVLDRDLCLVIGDGSLKGARYGVLGPNRFSHEEQADDRNYDQGQSM